MPIALLSEPYLVVGAGEIGTSAASLFSTMITSVSVAPTFSPV